MTGYDKKNDMLGKAKIAAEQAQATAATARVKADEGVAKLGDLTHKHRSTIDKQVDKAHAFVDSKTNGKQSDKLDKVRELVNKGLDALANKRPTSPARAADRAFDDAEV